MAGEFLPGNGFDTYENQDKVLVGMSGGVDSSVTVDILRQQGFGVVGAVIRFSPEHDKAVAAARKAAEQLGVECIVLDCEQMFRERVIEPFCESYCKGQTPNPCVICNPGVKFAALLAAADNLGIQYIATGHYARVEEAENGIYKVHTPESEARDQSYMLCRLDQQVLSRLILPLGEFEKDDIREMAKEMQLDCADAPDSMEICFIPDGDYAGYIEQAGYKGLEGRFIGPDGSDLGPHKGVLHYTVGQRKGLGLALGQPVFVSEIKPNGDVQLAVSGDEYFTGFAVQNLCTPDGQPLPAGEYLVKVRSAAKPVPCRYDGEGRVTFPEPVRAPAPGQSAVFYKDGFVMGGGFIADPVR